MKPLDFQEARHFLERKYQHAYGRSSAVRHILDCLRRFEPYMENDFFKEFTSGDNAKFQQRYWEMALGLHLCEIAGLPQKPKSVGPDFQLNLDGRRVFVEAVAPDRTTIISDWYNRLDEQNEASRRDDVPFFLRWTQAISEKSDKFKKYAKLGLVSTDDICIIAVNSALLGAVGAMGRTDFPAAVEIAFGIGPEYCMIDVSTGDVVGTYFDDEPDLKKETKTGISSVPKSFFTSPEHNHISAILASPASPLSQQLNLVCVHNPHAKTPLPVRSVRASWEYIWKGTSVTLLD